MAIRRHVRRPRHRKVHRAAGLSLQYRRLFSGHGLLAPAGGLLAPAGGRIRRVYRRKHGKGSVYAAGLRRKSHVRKHKRGGFLPFLPLIAAAVPAIMGAVSGAMDIAHKARALKQQGQGMRSRRRVVRKVHKRATGGAAKRRNYVSRHRRNRGRGVVSDFVGKIPLLGSILGPLTSAIGLGLTSPNNTWYLRQHERCGGMLSRNAIMITKPNPMMLVKYPSHADIVKSIKVGKGIHRKSHYRYVNGKRIHVSGSGMYKPRKHKQAKKKGGATKRKARKQYKRGGYNIFPWTSNVARIAYGH